MDVVTVVVVIIVYGLNHLALLSRVAHSVFDVDLFNVLILAESVSKLSSLILIVRYPILILLHMSVVKVNDNQGVKG
jgi:hypothetical protein